MAIRELDTFTLDNAAKHYAALFIADQPPRTRDWVMKEFYNFTYKDEFEYLVAAAKQHMGPAALANFEARVAKLEPRKDEVFHALLEQKRPVGYTPKEA